MSLIKTGREAVRYLGNRKMIQNPNPAIEMIKKQPTIESEKRIVYCYGGNKGLGHPRVFINLDHGVHTCGYCGQTFKQAAEHHH